MTILSRDAQIIASTFFSMGRVCRVSFACRRELTARVRKAFAELEDAGMIEPLPAGNLLYGTFGWQATAKIGRPISDFPRFQEHECFPVYLADEVAAQNTVAARSEWNAKPDMTRRLH